MPTYLKALIALLLLCTTPATAETIRLSGTIGTYAVEMELARDSAVPGAISGRYQYVGRDIWLTLPGMSFAAQALEMTESWRNDETGHFYLATQNGRLEGHWVNGTRDLPVTLYIKDGHLGQLEAPNALQPLTPSNIPGTYAVNWYWVNDWFAPKYEIGFNGGQAVVAAITAATLQIGFDLINGPTYHVASFRGQAQRTGPKTFTHNAILDYADAPCHLDFTFVKGRLDITQHSPSFDCGFGARAHAEFALEKVSDTVDTAALEW